MPKRKKKKQPIPMGPRSMKPGCMEANRQLDQLCAGALAVGIDVRVAYPENFGKCTMHVMFERCGVRLLNWWPATGTTTGCDGRKSTAADASKALRVAVVAMERSLDVELAHINRDAVADPTLTPPWES